MIPCCVKIKEAMGTFSPMEQQVAAFIINFPTDVAKMPIEELARSCNTSVSSVVRFCKSVNYEGYKEFLRVLSVDLALNSNNDTTYKEINPGDSAEAIARGICANHIKSIETTLSVIDMKEMEKAVEAVVSAKRVDFYGVGASGLVALDANAKFIRIGKISMSSNDPHQQILSATSLKKDDAAVLISYSGDSRDILELADIIKKTPAALISLTRCSRNELSKKADIRLYCSSLEQPVRSGVMGSRISSLTVIDILYAAVASAQYGEVKANLDKTQLASARKHLHPMMGYHQ